MALPGHPFQKLFGVLKTVAPTLLAATAGPFAPLALGIAKKVFGNDSMTDEALHEAVAAATGTSDGLVKLKEIEAALKQAEMDNSFKFAELAQRSVETEAKDRADARARQIALKDDMPAKVFYITSFGFFGTLAALFYFGLPDKGGEVILAMVGSLGAAWGAAVTYFVGSSAGSRAKDVALGKP